MRFPGFIGPSYTLQSVNVDCQRTVNLYPEINEAGTGDEGEPVSLVSTPGLKLLLTLPTAPVRGAYFDSKGQLWAVGGSTIYQISSSWTYTAAGTLNTTSGPVCFSDNGLEVVVVDGPFGYSSSITSASFSQIVDANFLGATQVDFIDGYLVFSKPNTQQFYISPLNAVTPFDGTMIGSAEAKPENLVGLVTTQENLYLLSGNHFEVWYDSGDTFPFARIQGAVSEIGCQSAFTVAQMQNVVYWLGKDKQGRGTVYRAQGLVPERISTFAIENVINSLGDLSNARAWTYQQAGHWFYCLNLPGASTTWVFDASTNQWHERAYLSAGQYSRHLADCHAFAFNTNVVGDFSSGNLYALDPATFTDNGNALVRERTAPHVSKDKKFISHAGFQLDLEAGVGTDGGGQGSNPKAVLQWSDDAGHSWSNEHWTTIGKIGSRLTRAIWRRLGCARDRVYRVRITDPVKVTIIGAEINLEEGAA